MAGDINGQLNVTYENIEKLLLSIAGTINFTQYRLVMIKAYIRLADHFPVVKEFLENAYPGVPVVLLQGDICRSDLDVEVDASAVLIA